MEQVVKRLKKTEETIVNECAATIRVMNKSLKSMSESYTALLKVNKAVVLYCEHVKKHQQDTTVDQIRTDLEQTNI